MSGFDKAIVLSSSKRPVWLLAAMAGMSFGLGPAWAQSAGQSGEPMYPEQVPVYDEPDDAHFAGEDDGGMTEQITGQTSGVNVSEYMTVDIFVQDEDLANVLQMLSLQSRRNIVASRDVSATVSANLYGVTFFEALDAILNVNGYAWYEEGNFIYVVPTDVAQAREEAQREVVAKVVQLSYLNANDAAEFVTPLLSEVGQIKTNGDAGEYNIPQDSPTGGEDFALAATLVIYDYPEHVDEIEALLDQLDTRPAQVLVESTILQTQLTEANAFGIDFAILADINFTDFFGFGGPLGSAAALGSAGNNAVAPGDNRGTSVVGSPGNFAGPGTFKAAIIHDDISVFIRALDEVTDVTILSNPKILALNRQPARVLVGRKLGYLNTTATETATTQTVEFLDTGTQLAFRPFISKDGNIRMELKPRVSEGVIRDATDVTGAAVTIPDEITQELTTNVIVPDGSTVVLGGLFKETSTLKRRQVPVLGDIPIVGLAFKGHEDDTDRSEIIFMIKPTIVSDNVLISQGDRAIEYGERIRAGTRQGLLPFSRDKQTKQHNVKAEQLATEGKYERALWELRRSLELNPNQPEAIRMMEELEGKKNTWPTPSILDRIIQGEVSKTVTRLGEGEALFQGEPIGAFDHYADPELLPHETPYVTPQTDLAESEGADGENQPIESVSVDEILRMFDESPYAQDEFETKTPSKFSTTPEPTKTPAPNTKVTEVPTGPMSSATTPTKPLQTFQPQPKSFQTLQQEHELAGGSQLKKTILEPNPDYPVVLKMEDGQMVGKLLAPGTINGADNNGVALVNGAPIWAWWMWPMTSWQAQTPTETQPRVTNVPTPTER